MRTGADYREALRDGRKVWVMGEGWAEDVTAHPATRAMVEEYALWYDRHFDPAWRDNLLAPPGADGEQTPWAFVLPRSADDLIGMTGQFDKRFLHRVFDVCRLNDVTSADRGDHRAILFHKAYKSIGIAIPAIMFNALCRLLHTSFKFPVSSFQFQAS